MELDRDGAEECGREGGRAGGGNGSGSGRRRRGLLIVSVLSGSFPTVVVDDLLG